MIHICKLFFLQAHMHVGKSHDVSRWTDQVRVPPDPLLGFVGDSPSFIYLRWPGATLLTKTFPYLTEINLEMTNTLLLYTPSFQNIELSTLCKKHGSVSSQCTSTQSKKQGWVVKWEWSRDIRSGSKAWLLMRSQQPILLILILLKHSPLPLQNSLFVCIFNIWEFFWLSSTGCGCTVHTFGKPRLYWQFQCLGTKTVFLWINGPIKRWEPQAGPDIQGVHCSFVHGAVYLKRMKVVFIWPNI